MSSRYLEVYGAWQADPHAFWAQAAREIDWIKPPQKIFDPDGGVYGHWFPDATCNTCYNALDRHVEGGRADQPARAAFLARPHGGCFRHGGDFSQRHSLTRHRHPA